MTHYPLLFGRRELLEGNGFIARVSVSGRALLADEDGEFWVRQQDRLAGAQRACEQAGGRSVPLAGLGEVELDRLARAGERVADVGADPAL